MNTSPMSPMTPTTPMRDLVMPPGSLGTASQLQPLGSLLAGTCRLHYLDLLGHAGRPIPASLSVQALAADVLDQMDQRGLQAAHVLGYSFGGCVALYLAHIAPERVLGVCNIAAKVVMDERAVRRGLLWARENYLAKPGSATHLELETAHPGVDWRELVRLLAALYKDLGQNTPLTVADVQALKPPCLTICGDRDPMVSWREAAELALQVPRSHCFTFAGRAHPLTDLPLPLVGSVIRSWLQLRA
jgi:pimeloyl-ACP methyl ester carboxylesterase